MSPRSFRSAVLIGFLAAACSGCELGHSFFHMDSNSPNPFFGFDLVPRRKTTSFAPPRGDGTFQLAGGFDQDEDAVRVR